MTEIREMGSLRFEQKPHMKAREDGWLVSTAKNLQWGAVATIGILGNVLWDDGLDRFIFVPRPGCAFDADALRTIELFIHDRMAARLEAQP